MVTDLTASYHSLPPEAVKTGSSDVSGRLCKKQTPAQKVTEGHESPPGDMSKLHPLLHNHALAKVLAVAGSGT